MLKKIKGCIVAVVILAFAIALWRTDWKGAYAPASDFVSFGTYASADSEYAELFRKHRDINALLHPLGKFEAYKKKKEREIKLRAKYEIKEVPGNYVFGMGGYVWFSFKSYFTSAAVWVQAALIVALIFGSGIAVRIFLYYALAKFFTGRRLRLFGDASQVVAGGIDFSGGGYKCVSIELPPQESLVVVNEDYINGYLNTPDLVKRTRWLFSWTYPIMSFFCGLRAMNEYINKGAKAVRVDVTSDDPNEYFIEIELKNCKGAFLVPSTLKAYTLDNANPDKGLKLSLAWRPFSITALCLKRIRYYKISGTGKIVLSAFGGFNGYELSEAVHRHKPSSLIFADVALEQSLARTETFYPYLCGRTDLFDLQIQGNGKFVAKNTISQKRFVDKMTSGDAILNGIGKLLGF